MSDDNGSSNRNKVLFGFGAVVAVLIAAILLWPSNFRKEDASGAIGAVQKHHAPQITQQDVVLGGEQVKAQQKILYTDFREDAAKLRALANESNAASREAFARELQARALGVAQQAARTLGNEDMNAMLAKGMLGVEDMQLFARNLGMEANSEKIASRINAISLANINLNDEQLVAHRLADVEASLASIDRDMEFVAASRYLENLAAEEALMQRGAAADFEALAMKLESQAKANEEMMAGEEAQLAARLADVEASLGTRYNSAAMVNNTVRGNISQAASRVQQRAALARTMSRSMNARSN